MLKNIYSVGQVNSYIKNLFSQDFLLRKISVKGEVSNCTYHGSGHIYFTIKDETGVLSAIMYASKRYAGLRFPMKKGDQVVVTGSIHVFERDGKYQLYAEKIELDGIGDLYLKFEALKQELEDMGMFDAIYKKKIPSHAMKIGIVTAPTGAAIQDICNIAKRRNPYVQLILYPALVQGDGAAQSIVNGIRALDAHGVDLLIVGRGGGSIEDLWAFNEEIVARAIFECNTPVISAVGHETDTTIADYVADLRAPTPSAAAELAVFDYDLFLGQLLQYRRSLNHKIQNKLQWKRAMMDAYKSRILLRSPSAKLKEQKVTIVRYTELMDKLFYQKFHDMLHRYELLYQRLEALSPMKKLSMGYALIASEEGKKINSIEQIHPEDELQIHMADGIVNAKVLEVNKIDRS